MFLPSASTTDTFHGNRGGTFAGGGAGFAGGGGMRPPGGCFPGAGIPGSMAFGSVAGSWISCHANAIRLPSGDHWYAPGMSQWYFGSPAILSTVVVFVATPYTANRSSEAGTPFRIRWQANS